MMTCRANKYHGSERVLLGSLTLALIVMSPAAAQNGEAVETTRVTLELRTGGAVSGLVVDHGEDGLVIVHERTPYAFSWRALTPASAMTVRQRLLTMDSDDGETLAPKDCVVLGRLALELDREVAAINLFRRAREADPALAPRIDEVLARYRARQADGSAGATPFQTLPMRRAASDDAGDRPGRLGERLPPTRTDPGVRGKVEAVYREFGEKVREVLGDDITLVETEHFLIWTDWRPRYRERLAQLSESMYRTLCAQFDLDPDDNLFLAKCPMFCWRSQERFIRFARDFDGHDGANATGYTRSIQRDGHVHVVLLRHGNSPVDFDRFAATLVHEGTHAFIHRLYSSQLIPHWVNEGFAEVISERVLGDRSDAAEEAAMLARAYVRYDWPLGDLLTDAGPIRVEQYGLACSVVGYLEKRGTDRFAELVRLLKKGRSITAGLAGAYDGLTPQRLERDWRAWVREHDPVLHPPMTEDNRLPWRR